MDFGGIVSPAAATLSDLIDGCRAQQEGGLVVAGVELGQCLVDARRVPDAALGRDVIGAHPEDPLQHELLEDGRVEGAVGLGVPRERPIKSRVGGQSQPVGAIELRVEVAEDADSFHAVGVELIFRDLIDLEELLQPGAEGLLLGGIVGESRNQAMGGKDGQPGVLQRDEGHQDVVGGTAGTDLALVGERGLVAVVAVGDQQLARLELGSDRLVDSRVFDPPDAVGRPVAIGHFAPGLAAEDRLEVAPGVAGMEGEDGGEVVSGGAGQSQPVLLGARLGPLVGADPLAVRSESDTREQAATSEP